MEYGLKPDSDQVMSRIAQTAHPAEYTSREHC